jgi:hypothetical protein
MAAEACAVYVADDEKAGRRANRLAGERFPIAPQLGDEAKLVQLEATCLSL